MLLTGSPAWAYRPFVSTDAAVADPKEVEIELGYFQFARTRDEDLFTTPTAVLNYGLVDRLEIVGEFAVEEGRHAGLQLVDPAVFLKAVLREGVLQEKSGLSVASRPGPCSRHPRPAKTGSASRQRGSPAGRSVR